LQKFKGKEASRANKSVAISAHASCQKEHLVHAQVIKLASQAAVSSACPDHSIDTLDHWCLFLQLLACLNCPEPKTSGASSSEAEFWRLVTAALISCSEWRATRHCFGKQNHRTCEARAMQARLAQLAERKALNLVVVGSTPTSGEHFDGFEKMKFCFWKNRHN
jgi:hypothetical protein